jgi:3-ketoacyl-CoA synthase
MAPPDAAPMAPRTRGPAKALFALVADNLATLVAVPVVALVAVSLFCFSFALLCVARPPQKIRRRRRTKKKLIFIHPSSLKLFPKQNKTNKQQQRAAAWAQDAGLASISPEDLLPHVLEQHALPLLPPALASSPLALVLALALFLVACAHLRLVFLVKPDRRFPVRLVDFAVTSPPRDWRFPRGWMPVLSRATDKFTDDELAFQDKVLLRSGLGDDTTVPWWLMSNPQHLDMAHARDEFEKMCFQCVDELMRKTGLNAKRDIHMVITNSSLFNPTPSLSATLMNHYKMPSTTLNYSLGGMGCSAGVVAVDLARQMLELYPETNVLVVSHENLTNNWYDGADRSMLVPNCIFRSNGAALLLSNKRRFAGAKSKYTLRELVRTTIAADDEAFECVYQCEDDRGKVGVRLRKELMQVAGRALKANITRLGPRVLPLSEKLLFAADLVGRKIGLVSKKSPAYLPDFSKAFEHLCIHTGGRGVIDAIEKQLQLPGTLVEPSRAALYRFGNVSSTSIWYVLSFVESGNGGDKKARGIKKGDKVWQLGFGSGFKCNSAVWVANRRVVDSHPAWEGFDVEELREELRGEKEIEFPTPLANFPPGTLADRLRTKGETAKAAAAVAAAGGGAAAAAAGGGKKGRHGAAVEVAARTRAH